MRILCTTTFVHALLLGAVPTSSLRDSKETTPLVTLSGTVTDAATAKPIASAQVNVGQTGLLTDSAGRYSLTVSVLRLPAILSVRVRGIGYKELTKAVTVQKPPATRRRTCR